MTVTAREIAVYSRRTGELVLLLEGVSCLTCGRDVVGADLDLDGRCPACAGADRACARCGVSAPVLDLLERGGELVCLRCAADADDEHEHEDCCGGGVCPRCAADGFAG